MSQLHKFLGNQNDFKWNNLHPEALNEQGLAAISKTVLIGESEDAPHFIMRYFQVGPQRHSRLERHPQEHEVIILHGKGQVRIGDRTHIIEPFDVVFIEGNELHQFLNPNNDMLGFICIIPKDS